MIGFILALGLVHAEVSPSEDAPVESPVMVEYGVIPEDVARIARAVVKAVGRRKAVRCVSLVVRHI